MPGGEIELRGTLEQRSQWWSRSGTVQWCLAAAVMPSESDDMPLPVQELLQCYHSDHSQSFAPGALRPSSNIDLRWSKVRYIFICSCYVASHLC